MTDIVTPEVRSRMMSRIRGRDTGPEKIVRSLLFRSGFRFRLHRRDLPGRPDIVLPKYRAVIFINGCFWHAHARCAYATSPSSNRKFWETKLAANQERDRRNIGKLRQAGWRVLVVWECTVRGKQDLFELEDQLGIWIRSAAESGELADIQ
jgi:DNA mismatch endonuclease (patch repair protein)